MTKPVRMTPGRKRMIDKIRAGVVFEAATPRLAEKVVAWAESPVLCDRCKEGEAADEMTAAVGALTKAIESEDWDAVAKVRDVLTEQASRWREIATCNIPWKERRGFIELAMRVAAEREVTRERLGLLINRPAQIEHQTVNILNYTPGMSEEQKQALQAARLNMLHGRALPEPQAETA